VDGTPSARSRSELIETLKIEEALANSELAPDYNVAPTKTSPAKTSPAVIARPRRGGGDAELDYATGVIRRKLSEGSGSVLWYGDH
jgi:hypothetical protein